MAAVHHETTDSPPFADVLRLGPMRTVFQPIVELTTGRTVAVEALTRGPASTPYERPDVLFALAEEQGHTVQLDQMCIQRALRIARSTRPEPPLVFVNVEPQTLAHPATARLLGALSDRIVVEVTERHLISDPAAVIRSVEAARAAGARIALDDVGVHHASTAFLAFVQPDIVKLDLSLIQGPPSKHVGRVATAVMAYAERSDAIILAEGIETEAHRQRALALGAELGQGYLFGHPAERIAPSDGELFRRSRVGQPWIAMPPCATPFQAVEQRRLVTRRADADLLLEISRHIEAQAELQSDLVLLGAFQDADRFTPDTARRYGELAGSTALVAALGVGLDAEPAPGVRGAALTPDDPLRGEWAVLALSPHYAGSLIARDLGDGGPRRKRRFDYVVTHDRDLVTMAALAAMQRVTAIDPRPA